MSHAGGNIEQIVPSTLLWLLLDGGMFDDVGVYQLTARCKLGWVQYSAMDNFSAVKGIVF